MVTTYIEWSQLLQIFFLYIVSKEKMTAFKIDNVLCSSENGLLKLQLFIIIIIIIINYYNYNYNLFLKSISFQNFQHHRLVILFFQQTHLLYLLLFSCQIVVSILLESILPKSRIKNKYRNKLSKPDHQTELKHNFTFKIKGTSSY